MSLLVRLRCSLPFIKSQNLNILYQHDVLHRVKTSSVFPQKILLEGNYLARFLFLFLSFSVFLCCCKVLDVTQHNKRIKTRRGGNRLWFNVPPRQPEIIIMVIIIIISSYEETEQTHIVQPSTEADL